MSGSRSPFFHVFKRRSKQAACSLGLDLRFGSWSIRIGNKTVAFRAMFSRVEAAANAVYNLDSSVTKDLPVFPNGILKQFFLQWTASLYADDKALQKLAESLIPQVNFGSARGVKSGRAGIDAVKVEEHDGGGLVVEDP